MEFLANADLRAAHLKTGKILSRKQKKRAKLLDKVSGSDRREHDDEDDDEGDILEAERQGARSFSKKDHPGATKLALPIKSSQGELTYQKKEQHATNQSEEASEESADEPSRSEDDASSSSSNENNAPAAAAPGSSRFREPVTVHACKLDIAALSESVLENPEHSVSNSNTLSRLHDYCEFSQFSAARRLAMLSLLAVYKDILPGYAIRIPTQKEKKTLISKEVRLLRKYESSLLQNYQRYLKLLESAVARYESQKKRSADSTTKVANSLAHSFAVIAMRCICTIYIAKPQFNFRDNLLAMIVPRMSSSDIEMQTLCCTCVTTLLKEDLEGEVTLDIIRLVSKMSQSDTVRLSPQALEPFLSLMLTADLNDTNRIIALKRARNAKKRARRLDSIQAGLEESEASHNPLEVHARQAEALRELFTMYLRILKRSGNASTTIPVVLRGIARFVHLINADLVESLLNSLGDLLESKKLSTASTLQAVLTILRALHGPGRELQLDESVFSRALHDELVRMQLSSLGSAAAAVSSYADDADPTLLALQCVDMILSNRHHHVSSERVKIFTRRLSSLALSALPANCTVALLTGLRSIMHKHQGARDLLEKENGLGMAIAKLLAGSSARERKKHSKSSSSAAAAAASVNDDDFAGVLRVPALDEQEDDTDSGRSMWELSLLRNHYHPVVSSLASSALSMAPMLASEKPGVVLSLYDFSREGVLNPPMRPPPKSSTTSHVDPKSAAAAAAVPAAQQTNDKLSKKERMRMERKLKRKRAKKPAGNSHRVFIDPLFSGNSSSGSIATSKEEEKSREAFRTYFDSMN